MTDYVAPSTELEAVNAILHTIGETPVDSLTGDLPADAEKALQILKYVSRTVQTRGWHFNTETEYPLSRDVDNKIPLPQNTLRVDADAADTGLNVVQRGGFLYDKTKHSFIFTKNITVRIVLLLPFEDIPAAARDYITVRAARRFQAGQMGSQLLDAFTAEDEQQARLTLEHAEADTEDANVFTDSNDVLDVWFRPDGHLL